MNYFNLTHFSVFTVRAGPQVGPGRFQAGMEAEEAGLRAGPDRGHAGAAPEAAGLVAGPGRALGRASIGTSRPAGRLRPTPRPGRAGACGGQVLTTMTSPATKNPAAGEGKSARGEA